MSSLPEVFLEDVGRRCGALLSTSQKYSTGSSCALWMSKSDGDEGCHESCRTGECCIITAAAVSLVKSQIHTAVGAESSLVAIIVPSELNAMIDIPVFRHGSGPDGETVGGDTG